MKRLSLAVCLVLTLILTASCTWPSVGPSNVHDERGEQQTYVPDYVGGGLSQSRAWADVAMVSYLAGSSDREPSVEIVGAAISQPPSNPIDVYVYASDGSCGPVTEFTLSPDQQFRLVVELSEQHMTQELSRFEVISIGGQWIFVDVAKDVWAAKDGGVLLPLADPSR